MNAKDFELLLDRINACSEAITWADGKSLRRVWKTCGRGDWMLWLCGRMSGKEGWPTRQAVVLVACLCAERALPLWEKKYPKDKRPHVAIETARRWAQGKATITEVRSAADAAFAAAASASADAAADAAAFAADAATAAAIASDAAARSARRASLKDSADLCRKHLNVSIICK